MDLPPSYSEIFSPHPPPYSSLKPSNNAGSQPPRRHVAILNTLPVLVQVPSHTGPSNPTGVSIDIPLNQPQGFQSQILLILQTPGRRDGGVEGQSSTVATVRPPCESVVRVEEVGTPRERSTAAGDKRSRKCLVDCDYFKVVTLLLCFIFILLIWSVLSAIKKKNDFQRRAFERTQIQLYPEERMSTVETLWRILLKKYARVKLNNNSTNNNSSPGKDIQSGS